MATALQLPAQDAGPVTLASPRAHMTDTPARLSVTDLDLRDTRYPTLNSSRSSWINYPVNGSPRSWMSEKLVEDPAEDPQPAQGASSGLAMKQPLQAQSSNADGTFPPYAPGGSSPRLVDRFSRDESLQRRPSKGSERSRPRADTSPTQDMGQRTSTYRQSQDQFGSLAPPTSRQPSLPAPGISAGPSASPSSPMVALAPGPSYTPSAMQVHISPKPRASAQYPTYINPPPGRNPMNPAFAPAQMPKEEVCVECAMRDQDMADVDVTSPGVWERESDVLYEELVHREQEEEATGIRYPDSASRPPAGGQPLSEENMRLWISMNPKEPSSRQQTLDQYVRSQRTLLEAEALAHARAMQEAKQLEDRMRNTYSQLRRSAYELGTTLQVTENDGVRVKPPRTTSMPAAAVLAVNTAKNGHEVTLLENGMIVEHVDMRKEEKEERERRRREERRGRARKSSRSSVVDVASVYSMPIPGQKLHTDSGYFSGGVRGSESRVSQSFSPRPSSVLATGADRPHMLPRAYSQASFSDMQSIGSSVSPRRSRFFGFKNLTAGWRSQESFAPSGSMMDMHVALQHEQQYLQEHPPEMASNTSTLRVGDAYAKEEAPSRTETPTTQPAKKKNGFKKIWKIVTGSKNGSGQKGRDAARSVDKAEDDTPLAPPPPLSYLVDRERGPSSRRHVSTPSLPSSVSPNAMSLHAPSPPTAPSSLAPSPTSSRQPINDRDNVSEHRKNSSTLDVDQDHQGPSGECNSPECEARGRATQSSSKTLSSYMGPQTPATAYSLRPQSIAIRRDKSLPPLPGESSVEFPDNLLPDMRPQTMFTYNHIPMSFSGDLSPNRLLPPNAPFRTADQRRQSFGGVASAPHPAARSLPAKGLLGLVTPGPAAPFQAEERYGEFGASRLSLSQWDSARGSQRSRDGTAKPKQRRSKFGLASLFSKKSHGGDSKESGYPEPEYSVSGFRSSGSEQDAAPTGNSYEPGSAHSSHVQRASIASRKNIAELVEQDREFVAYRYPSTDQRFDLGS
ncbi:hypothetical protein POSPLADRAFT_1073005 [Postia placenta MAD-698-R-SB12]|uniref:Proteophosphoglycan ppg4 n=1 Tax=Postia placenta MAD-698-R-SB12 TaxID=670580 RepID=A0A1X6ND85_9APHY|nr:hypothetical protein POSPLADRAFT_1073005 [Postia placenta MAD-698-R-SB12]OSX66396.1 hypothetical protein POSPLADRAFT_1073005 [Postia placenta MAD-698-R-SB12]